MQTNTNIKYRYASGVEDWTEDDEGEFHSVLLAHNDREAFDWASVHLYTVCVCVCARAQPCRH